MPYTTHTTVEAPVAMYDAIHAHVLDTTKGTIDGLLVHLARPTPTGFEVFEVWESREHCDKFSQDLLGAVFAAAATDAGTAGTLPQPHVEDFTPSGLVIPQANIAI
jgi:hypothetical protein